MICGICATKTLLFFSGKTYSIDNYEIANFFNMLDHLLTNIIYTVIHT